MTAKNISLDRYKQRFFGDFLELPGLTEIAVNRPGELYTKINGVWEQHAVPLNYEDCYNFARCLAKHHGDNIEDIKPGLSATLESGERCQGRCEQVPDMRSSYSSGAHPRGTS